MAKKGLNSTYYDVKTQHCNMKEYTVGEIFRLKLLKNKNGQPYKDKGAVSNVLARYPHKTKMTPHGQAKLFSEETINKINQRW